MAVYEYTATFLITLKEVINIIDILLILAFIAVGTIFSIITFRIYFNASSIDTKIETYVHVSDALLRLINFCKDNSLEVKELYHLYKQLDQYIQFFNFLELHKIVVHYREELELIDAIDSVSKDPYMLEAVLIGIERLNKHLYNKRKNPYNTGSSSIELELDLFGRILR